MRLVLEIMLIKLIWAIEHYLQTLLILRCHLQEIWRRIWVFIRHSKIRWLGSYPSRIISSSGPVPLTKYSGHFVPMRSTQSTAIDLIYRTCDELTFVSKQVCYDWGNILWHSWPFDTSFRWKSSCTKCCSMCHHGCLDPPSVKDRLVLYSKLH
jgi:hypothetical protein